MATDLDTSVLETGRKGIYPEDKIARLPPGHAHKYFDKLPDGTYQAKAVLRNMITFQRLNLIENNWALRKQFDAIFCRNVMIYFDRDTQFAVLKNLPRCSSLMACCLSATRKTSILPRTTSSCAAKPCISTRRKSSVSPIEPCCAAA
jgi:hypothetical protein